MTRTRRDGPASFRDLHYAGTPLVLPNAWDVPSALAFVDAGFPAVGTTSFGVVASRGRPDGARHSMKANVRLVAALARLDCFVSVDIEDGYADDPDAVAEYVAIPRSSSTPGWTRTGSGRTPAAVLRIQALPQGRRSTAPDATSRPAPMASSSRAAIDTAVGAAVSVRDGGPIPAATTYGQMQSRLLAYHRAVMSASANSRWQRG